MPFAKQTSKTFKHALIYFLAVFGLLAVVFSEIYQKIGLYWPVLVHKIKDVCDCAEMSHLSGHPYFLFFFGILGTLAAVFIFYSFYKLITMVARTRKYLAFHLGYSKPGHSAKLKRIIRKIGLERTKVVEIASRTPVVFCFGVWRKRICVSAGLVKTLTDAELKAVLSHEWQHLKSNDPLRLFVLKYFQSILFFAPGVKTIIKKFVTFSELAADEKATENFTDKLTLARAIAKVIQTGGGSPERASGLALSFFSSVIAERVNRLADNDYMPKFKLFSKGFVFGAASIVIGTLLLFVFLADTSKAFVAAGASSCASPATAVHSSKNACVMENSYSRACQTGYGLAG